ncbi:MAG: hypothetical protein AB7O67_07245 [Vicinamibacterales bacterium]
MSFTRWLQKHRALIDRTIDAVVRRYHLSGVEADELVARVRRTLVADDYAALRGFTGRSTLQTYVAALVTREYLGFQRELWGGWEPSALARRHGPTAILLEELTVRDGMAFGDAVTVMQTTYGVTLSRDALYDLLQELAVARAFGEDGAAPPSPDAAERRSRIERVDRALRDALQLVSPEDRLLLSMKYLEQAPVSGIARLLGLEPRPSLRRLEQATDVVRAALLTQGLPAEDVEAVLGSAPTPESQALRLRWWKSALPRPSH